MLRSYITNRPILTAVVVLLLLATGVIAFQTVAVLTLEEALSEQQEQSEKLTTAGLAEDNVTTASHDGHIPVFNTMTGDGHLVEYEYQPLPTDRIYIGVGTPPVGINLQRAVIDAQTAVKRSEYEPRYDGFQLDTDGVDDWEQLDGRSAGLPIAASYAATDPAYERNSSVILTGDVRTNGDIRAVHRVAEKADAAAEEGYDAIVIPRGEPLHTTHEEIEIVRVDTIEEALDIALDTAA